MSKFRFSICRTLVFLIFISGRLNAQICFSQPNNFGFAHLNYSYSLCNGDFNSDGIIDLAVANPNGANSIGVFFGNGAGAFSYFADFPTGTSPREIICNDFNLDGKLDLVTANDSSNNISILIGNGNGTFALPNNFSVGVSPYSVCSADFDGDGNLDLATANIGTDNLSVLLGNGLGGFGSPLNLAVISNPTSIISADFNNDGNKDLAATNSGFFRVSVFLGNGLGAFGTATNFLVGTNPTSLISADFDMDGNMDLAAANQGSGNVSVLMGNGAGNFGTASNYAAGLYPMAVTFADFDSDANIDLAVTNSGNDNISILKGNGLGGFNAPKNFATGIAPVGLTKVDFNGDGKIDLASINSNSNNVSVLLNGPPLVTANSNFPSVCQGNPITLSGGGATSYSWTNSVVNGTSFVPSTTQTYTVTGTYGVGCSNTATINIVVNSLPVVGINSTGNTICFGDQLTLNGIGANSYSWSHGITDGISFTPSSGNTFTVTGTDVNFCTNTASQTIIVNSLPVVTALISNTIVCEGEQITLTGLGDPATYTWTSGVANGVSFEALSTQTYTVTGTDINGCSNDDVATIVVNSLPIVIAHSTDTVICQGDQIVLTGSGADSFNWSNGINDGESFSPSASQTYTLIGTDGNNCSNSSTISVTVYDLPLVTANATEINICSGGQVTLTGGGAGLYTWSGGITDGVPFSLLLTETYTVSGQDTNGCFGDATITLSATTNPTPQICMVTVDDPGNNNIIYWDKTNYGMADTFFVYREITNGNYQIIGKVPYDSLSQFVDTVRTLYFPNTGNPREFSFKYKIAIKDTCGNLSAMSLYHGTMFLQDQLNGNFNWTHYEIEGQTIPVPALLNYRFLRDNDFNGIFETTIGTTTNDLATDSQYLTYQNTADWRIETDWTISCEPTLRVAGGKDINTVVVRSKSNIKNNRTVGIKSDIKNVITKIKVYPNPANDLLNVDISLSKEAQATITLENMLGAFVYTMQTNKPINSINTSNLMSGVYFVKVKTGKGISIEKIIIE